MESNSKMPEAAPEKPKPREVITEKGSVYKYLPDGRTQRFKTATGELLEPQDILVFIPPWEMIKDKAVELYPEIFRGIENQVQYEQVLLEYAQIPGKTIRVSDENGKELKNNPELAEAKQVFIHFVHKTDPKKSFNLPVSIEPKVGYLTADTRKYKDKDGTTIRERHIGNPVKEILYEPK